MVSLDLHPTHPTGGWFRRFATHASNLVGSSYAFFFALGAIAAWAASGPLFHFSDTWQLVINTSTTIITFLTVFLIQHTQNRDAMAIHLKLDELIRAIGPARNSVIDLDELDDAQLRRLEAEYKKIAAEPPPPSA